MAPGAEDGVTRMNVHKCYWYANSPKSGRVMPHLALLGDEALLIYKGRIFILATISFQTCAEALQ